MSDAGVPGVAILASHSAAAITEPFQTVCDRQASDEFYVLVADLPREPHAKRSTVGYWKITAIHAVTEKCLRMQSIGHVDAVPCIGFHRDIHDVSGLGVDPDKMQDVGERHANPLGDVGPAFFTGEFGDVAARRVALEVSNREQRRLMDHAIDGEPPVCESARLKALKVFREGREFVREWTRRNLVCYRETKFPDTSLLTPCSISTSEESFLREIVVLRENQGGILRPESFKFPVLFPVSREFSQRRVSARLHDLPTFPSSLVNRALRIRDLGSERRKRSWSHWGRVRKP